MRLSQHELQPPSAALFAVSLRRLRHRRGWTLKELAAASGVCAETISGIERGRSGPSLHAAILLARAFGASLDMMTAGLAQPPEQAS